jgi:hypothetical protein
MENDARTQGWKRESFRDKPSRASGFLFGRLPQHLAKSEDTDFGREFNTY